MNLIQWHDQKFNAMKSTSKPIFRTLSLVAFSTAIGCLTIYTAYSFLKTNEPADGVKIISQQATPVDAKRSISHPPNIITKSDNKPISSETSTSQRIESLRNTKTPEDAFAAYQIIQKCVLARRFDSEGRPNNTISPEGGNTEQICGDITAAQIVSRLQLLEKAAAAGVHNAMYSFAAEGPEGYGIGGNEDPSSAPMIEWTRRIKEYQEAGAKTGDRYSLISLSNRYENDSPPDMQRALTYWVAQHEIAKKSNSKIDKNYESIITRMSTSLTEEQVKNAISTGKEIASTTYKSKP